MREILSCLLSTSQRQNVTWTGAMIRAELAEPIAAWNLLRNRMADAHVYEVRPRKDRRDDGKFLQSKKQLKHSLIPCFQRLNSSGYAGETNRRRDAWRVEALRDLREGLGTLLATEWERSGDKDCAICKEIWIPSEVL